MRLRLTQASQPPSSLGLADGTGAEYVSQLFFEQVGAVEHLVIALDAGQGGLFGAGEFEHVLQQRPPAPF